jgi:hypothetical protein
MAKDVFRKYVYSEYSFLLSPPKQKYPYFKFSVMHCEEKFPFLISFQRQFNDSNSMEHIC